MTNEWITNRHPQTGVRDCLSCSNSFSEQKDDGNDVLHCMVHNEEIVKEDYCCEDYN